MFTKFFYYNKILKSTELLFKAKKFRTEYSKEISDLSFQNLSILFNNIFILYSNHFLNYSLMATKCNFLNLSYDMGKKKFPFSLHETNKNKSTMKR